MDDTKYLTELLIYVYKKIPYYRAQFCCKEQNWDNVEKDFQTLPIVDKKIIRQDYAQFISTDFDRDKLQSIISQKIDFKKEHNFTVSDQKIVVEYTTGSNGTPFMSLKTVKERSLLGRSLWKKRNALSPVHIKELFCFIHNFDRLEYPFPFERCGNTQERIEKEFDYLNKNRFKWWHINAGRLSYYYEWVVKKDIRFDGLQVIENNGSYLSQQEKNKYAKAFNCRIVDHYGCREAWTIAFDCKEGYFHVDDACVYVELVDENDCVIHEDNVPGQVVITTLKQRCMPFLRYKLDDFAYFVSGKCPCGSSARRLVLLPGRHLIKGTDIYGNLLFKKVILDIIHKYDLSHFGEISITQYDFYKFIVNVSELESSKEEFENIFKKLAIQELTDSRYQFQFTYDNMHHSKNLFQVK